MVIMNARQTNVKLTERNKTYDNRIVGIKGDSVVATAKDVVLSGVIVEALDGAKTMQEAVEKLSELAVTAKQDIVDNSKKAKTYALIMG